MDIIHLDNTTSTSDYLLNLHTDKDVVAVADYQSAGRGAGTNRWESEPGKNLLFSMLIHPTWLEPRNQFVMSMIHALALLDVLSEYEKPRNQKVGKYESAFTIKWPNDIYWYDKKISGTIIDCTMKGGRISDMVIGTGININQEKFLSDAPNPVSLCQITGMQHSCREILQNVVDSFSTGSVPVENENVVDSSWYDMISRRYHEHLYRRKGFYTYEDNDGRFEAELVKVQKNGIMQLRRKDGTISSYEFKEVKFVLTSD